MLNLPCCLFSCFFSVLVIIVVRSLGEEGAGLFASPIFVCLFCMRRTLSLSLSGVGCGL